MNDLLDKKKVGSVISDCYKRFGQAKTINLLDDLKDAGFTQATLAGISISITDLTILEEKKKILEESHQEVHKVDDQYHKGIITGRVSVREAHPGANAPQPTAFEEKHEHAERLRDLHDIAYEVAIDDIDGTLHRALSPKPNSAYLLGTDGTILFRAHWANDTKALAQALDAVSGERPLRRTESRGLIRPLWPTVRYIAPTLDRAGRGAWRDMWLAAPPMAAAAFLLRLLHLVPKPGSPWHRGVQKCPGSLSFV